MELGATLGLSQSGRPVAFGLIAGAGLSGRCPLSLMSRPAAAQIEIIDLFDPVAYGGSLLCIVAACLAAAAIPALRAARIDPIATLKQE